MGTLQVLKTYSVIILILEIFFVVFIGDAESSYEDSTDRWLAKSYPDFYWSLSIFGFRMHRSHD